MKQENLREYAHTITFQLRESRFLTKCTFWFFITIVEVLICIRITISMKNCRIGFRGKYLQDKLKAKIHIPDFSKLKNEIINCWFFIENLVWKLWFSLPASYIYFEEFSIWKYKRMRSNATLSCQWVWLVSSASVQRLKMIAIWSMTMFISKLVFAPLMLNEGSVI